MIKDRILKIKLLKYFVHRNWYPQLEVDILSKPQISSNRKLITDIDVLGLFPDVTGNLNPILGDCKTLKNQSPIARTLWMKGLMEYLDATKGMIILQKEIEKDHQLTSHHLNIQLLSEQDFDTYSKHTLNPLMAFKSALCEGDNWDAFFDIENKFPAIKSLSLFSKTDFWNETKSSNRLRHSLHALRLVKKELNPSNNLHLSLVLNHFSLVAIAINDMITKIFNRYLLPKSKQELDDDLKLIIWGGLENYNYLNDLRKRFGGNAVAENDLSLPKWDLFIELIRLFLDNPLSFNQVPLFIKEHAFRFINVNETYDFSKQIAKDNSYVISHAIRLTDYLVKASDLPPEFNETFTSKFMDS